MYMCLSAGQPELVIIKKAAARNGGCFGVVTEKAYLLQYYFSKFLNVLIVIGRDLTLYHAAIRGKINTFSLILHFILTYAQISRLFFWQKRRCQTFCSA
ncbi:hypothetical protein CBW46_009290 [Paenibacillus xerothermodurans]|uniref:Uncharacterized protein n=1 Tax=Paenibacillus xerothermodurans TaxID=1977292 RepID=A0A2W1NAD1_PAEXE|nr:hypothetical protein CBW46_009290 [Paenibacillus xerothermodurans]